MKDKTVTITFRLTEHEHSLVLERASKAGDSVGQHVRSLVRDELAGSKEIERRAEMKAIKDELNRIQEIVRKATIGTLAYGGRTPLDKAEDWVSENLL